jgi:arylsulfatase A-like enzyme
VIRYPDGRAGVDERVADLVDLLPNTLELFEISVPDGLAGRSLLGPADPLRAVTSETVRGGATLRAVRVGDRKLILDGTTRVFDRDVDPRERRTLGPRRGDEPLLDALAAWPGPLWAEGAAELSAAERGWLEALGYVEQPEGSLWRRPRPAREEGVAYR